MAEATDHLLTIDHVHQYAYCPRRMHLMVVGGRWEDNEYTEEGRVAHRRTDSEEDLLPEPGPAVQEGEPPPEIARSVWLSDETLGLTGKLDLVETEGGRAIPVDVKRGHPPEVPGQCYEPERVQLMAQGLLLRAHGFQCDTGMLYFAGARRRVMVPLTSDLEARTLHLIAAARRALETSQPPPPLENSPKCIGCSLSGICLPDETNLLLGRGPVETLDVRRLYPARDDALPLYVQEQGARVGKSGECVIVFRGKEECARVPLKDISQLVLCGNITCSPQAIHLLCEYGIPIIHLSMGGWFYGLTYHHGLKNAYARAAQFRMAENESRCLAYAKRIIEAKIKNQRTIIRRNGRDVDPALARLARISDDVEHADSRETLLGLEGTAAREYFSSWRTVLQDEALAARFDHEGRNRRPPKDPVNAMLSYSYALLLKECTVALLAEGLDPWWGFYHRPRHGKPALALDLMEEFRPLIADSAVISAVNNGMVRMSDFELGVNACGMRGPARKSLIQAFELRLDQLVTHPIFDYRCSWRSVLRLQARLLARWISGEFPAYTPMTTR